MARWHDGRIKLLVTTGGLRSRRQHMSLVLDGTYTPLEADGAGRDHVVAFARHDDSGALLVMVPRFAVSLADEL